MKKEYMKLAYKEANKALKCDEVPVGCVIIKNDTVISKAYNKRECLNNVTRHAEIIAIEKACKKIGDWRLDECEMYVTLEPCAMCRGAIVESRIKKVYYGLKRDKKEISFTKYINIKEYNKICQKMISEFFERKRNK